jgi:HEAT repeat protein
VNGRRIFWLAGLIAALALAAVSVPSSPVHLAKLFGSGPHYDGHPLSHWLDSLETGDVAQRKRAIYAVGVIGPDAHAAVPVLARIMVEDDDPRLRHEAAFTLSKLAPATRTAVAELSGALQDDEPVVRFNAARALYKLGVEARSAVPALIAALDDPDNDTNANLFACTVQGQIALALGEASAGSADGVTALRKALAGAKDDEARTTFLWAISSVGPPAAPALEEVRPFTGARNSELRRAAEEAVQNIEGAAQ